MPSLDQSIADIVSEHSAAALVFHKHGIDYCCHGDRSVRQAAGERGVDVGVLLAELDEAISERRDRADEPRDLSQIELVEHIMARHHAYLRKAMPFIMTLTEKVARVHGERNPKLEELDAVFCDIVAELEPHLDSEEQVLFPAIMSGGERGMIVRALSEMHAEHLVVGDLLARMRELADDYVVPEWACRTYRTMLSELEEFEKDTMRHVHIESHVLKARFE